MTGLYITISLSSSRCCERRILSIIILHVDFSCHSKLAISNIILYDVHASLSRRQRSSCNCDGDFDFIDIFVEIQCWSLLARFEGFARRLSPRARLACATTTPRLIKQRQTSRAVINVINNSSVLSLRESRCSLVSRRKAALRNVTASSNDTAIR